MKNILDLAKNKRENTRKIEEDVIYRWSPRSMSGEPIPESALLDLFDAARYSPSAFNAQPQRYYYSERGTESFKTILSFLSPFNQVWCANASFLIILVSKKTFEHNGKFDRTHSFDTGASWEAFAVEGIRRNLVVHGMSGFDYSKAEAFLKLGDDYNVECMIAVGIPTEAATKEEITMRKPIKEIAIKLQ